MAEQGLTNRLRQKSRRSGLAIAISMVLTIALCLGVSAWIYGKTEPWVSDFAGVSESATTEPTVAIDVAENSNASGSASNDQSSAAQQPTVSGTQAAGIETEPTIAALSTASTGPFNETHLSNPEFSVNLRPGPSVFSGDPIGTLPPSTRLEFQDQQGQDEEGSIWLLMETSTGLSGWIRGVDTVEIT